MQKNSFTVKRIVTDALLAAMFFTLSLMSVEIAGVKVTFVSLATVICAMLYGPIDAIIVCMLGAFLEQMLKYGITATTLLWIAPAGIRAAIIGISALLLRRYMSVESVLEKKRPYVYFTVCIVAGLITSCANTAVFYIDAKIFGYYNYEMIFGILGVRLITGMMASFVTAIVARPILAALKKAKFID